MVVFCFLIFRLYQLQVVESDQSKEKARLQHVRSYPIPAERGTILTQSGDVLATSRKVYQVYGEIERLRPDESSTRQMTHGKLDRMLADLAQILPIDVEAVRQLILKTEDPFIRLASDVSKADADLLRDLVRNKDYLGISIEESNKRYYPYHSLSSQTIGLVNSEERGFLGIESYYNTLLAGTDGEERVTTDVNGKPLPYGVRERREPNHGADIVLTLDHTYQFFLENRVEEAVKETDAKSAAAVLIDVNSGEIYAMASYPTFDLNAPFDLGERSLPAEWETMTDQERSNYYFNHVWNNPVISSIYEPGSTMKTVITAIGLNEGVITPYSGFSCSGSKQVEEETIKCISYPYGHGEQDLVTAFLNSCNVAYMEIGRRIGKETFYSYFDRVGLFRPTGVDLPAEASPNYLALEGLRDIELATMSFGHTIGVSMLQVVSALSSTVNGGYVVHPHVLKEIRYSDGKIEYPPVVPRERVFSAETVETMKDILAAWAKNQGERLHIDGVALGGKTGTSVKFIDGEYREDRVISSCIVFAPIDAPKYALLVQIDEPDVETHSLRVGVKLADRILKDIYRQESITSTSPAGYVTVVPDVVGRTVAEARAVLAEAGLALSDDMTEEHDDRLIDEQFPAAGVSVPEGTLVILKLKEMR